MTRLKKIGILAVMMCMLIPYSAFAQDQVNPYGLSDESVTFLQSHGVSLSVFGSSNALSETEKVIPLDDSIISLERQAEAYGYTDDQIQKYVQGMVNTPTHIIKDSDFAGSDESYPNWGTKNGAVLNRQISLCNGRMRNSILPIFTHLRIMDLLTLQIRIPTVAVCLVFPE